MALVVLLVTMYATGAARPDAQGRARRHRVPHRRTASSTSLGLKTIRKRAPIEFVVALITAVVVCAVGVEQGIILAIVLSILALVRRQYKPSDFVVGVDASGEPTYQRGRAPGMQSLPGLIVFRYDAELFYANANRFVDDVQRRW